MALSPLTMRSTVALTFAQIADRLQPDPALVAPEWGEHFDLSGLLHRVAYVALLILVSKIPLQKQIYELAKVLAKLDVFVLAELKGALDDAVVLLEAFGEEVGYACRQADARREAELRDKRDGHDGNRYAEYGYNHAA